VYAKEMAYKDWEGAAANISKAAELLSVSTLFEGLFFTLNDG